jgi:hypothetical protein
MKQEQKKYAMGRIDQVINSKMNEARRKFSTPEIRLSNEDKLKLIKAGKVELKAGHYGEFTADFSKFERNEAFDHDKYKVIEKDLFALATTAKDKIMLGDDCESAMKVLETLENYKI